MTTRLLSSDSHIVEPPDLWSNRLPADLGERGPLVRRHDDGTDFWYVDGQQTCSFTGGIQMGQRFDQPETLRSAGSFAEVPRSAYDPAAHLADNERDLVVGSVIYPSAGLVMFQNIQDRPFFTAVCRAYNDWLAEFCSYDIGRLKGVAMINVDDVNEGVAEMERVRALGLAGALITVYPGDDRPYLLPEYEPLWSAAADLAMPLGMHIATNRVSVTKGQYGRLSQSILSTQDYWLRRSLADIIFSGVFERHPTLRIGSVEHEVGWAPYFLDTIDYTYTQRPHRPGWHRYKSTDVIPSDFFRSNVFISFQEDVRGLREWERLGIDSLLWGSDYPHTETTFPRSAQVLEDLFEQASIPESLRSRVSFDNAQSLYGFDALPV